MFFLFLEPIQSKLEKYRELIEKWQNAVNLVSSSTLLNIYERHFYDSAQLWPFVKEYDGVLADMGSGAGFPGIVLALCNENLNGNFSEVRLIESDVKKSIFLKEVVRELGLKKVKVINKRIEILNSTDSDVVTSRALSDVKSLLNLSKGISKNKTVYFFLKGKTVDQEIFGLKDKWEIKKHPSHTNCDGVILEMKEIK